MPGKPMLAGLNHITLAVADLNRSLCFYRDVLEFVPEVKWRKGAYLSLGDLWLCLTVEETVDQRNDYTHIAFNIDGAQFSTMQKRLQEFDVQIWKANSSEGDSIYLLDPDKHKLEIHVGSLQSRLQALKNQPYDELEWF